MRLMMLLPLSLLVFGSSCRSMKYGVDENGPNFESRSFGSKSELAGLTFEVDSDGVRKVSVERLANDETKAIGKVIEFAIQQGISVQEGNKELEQLLNRFDETESQVVEMMKILKRLDGVEEEEADANETTGEKESRILEETAGVFVRGLTTNDYSLSPIFR